MTALPALISTDDLAAWLGVIADAAFATRAEAIINAASATVRAASGQSWVDTNGDLLADIPDDVRQITVRVSARMLSNPSGVSQQTTGPFSVSYGTALAADDRDLLQRYRPTNGVWTLATTRLDTDGPLETGTVYAPVGDGSGDPIPMISPEPS